MIEEEKPRTLDFNAMKLAIEEGDPEMLLSFYAGDARIRIITPGAPASQAFELRGRAEIERYLRSISEQGVISRVEAESVGAGSIQFSEFCEYPDGSRIQVRTTLEVLGGEISSQLDVVSVQGNEGTRRTQTGEKRDR